MTLVIKKAINNIIYETCISGYYVLFVSRKKVPIISFTCKHG